MEILHDLASPESIHLQTRRGTAPKRYQFLIIHKADSCPETKQPFSRVQIKTPRILTCKETPSRGGLRGRQRNLQDTPYKNPCPRTNQSGAPTAGQHIRRPSSTQVTTRAVHAPIQGLPSGLQLRRGPGLPSVYADVHPHDCATPAAKRVPFHRHLFVVRRDGRTVRRGQDGGVHRQLLYGRRLQSAHATRERVVRFPPFVRWNSEDCCRERTQRITLSASRGSLLLSSHGRRNSTQ